MYQRRSSRLDPPSPGVRRVSGQTRAVSCELERGLTSAYTVYRTLFNGHVDRLPAAAEPVAQRPKVTAFRSSSHSERLDDNAMHVASHAHFRAHLFVYPLAAQPTVVAETPQNKQGAPDPGGTRRPRTPRFHAEEPEEEQEVVEQEDSCYLKIQQDKYSNKELVKINRGELGIHGGRAGVRARIFETRDAPSSSARATTESSTNDCTIGGVNRIYW